MSPKNWAIWASSSAHPADALADHLAERAAQLSTTGTGARDTEVMVGAERIRDLAVEPVGGEPCVGVVPLFAGLTPAQQAEVARFARPLKLAAGAFAFRVGEPRPRLFVVHEGRVKISQVSAAGRETILRVLGPGEVAGEVSFLTGAAPENDAVAMVPSGACVFEHGDLAVLVGRFPGIGVGMLRALGSKLASTERMLTALTSADVGARIAAYLLDCSASWDASGLPTVRLPMAKKDVASFLGTTPETVSRRLADFERDGLIRLLPGRNLMIMNPSRLAARASL